MGVGQVPSIQDESIPCSSCVPPRRAYATPTNGNDQIWCEGHERVSDHTEGVIDATRQSMASGSAFEWFL
jgi:hypothetical protein